MATMATTPDVATPLPSTSQPPSSVSLKTPASEHNVHDTFRYGFKSAKSDIMPSHPLEMSEANFERNYNQFMLQSLRDSQGLHAPMKLQMERKMASKIQRIPPLPSSMIALETLLGKDETLSIEELLDGSPGDNMNINGRSIMEKRLKMI